MNRAYTHQVHTIQDLNTWDLDISPYVYLFSPLLLFFILSHSRPLFPQCITQWADLQPIHSIDGASYGNPYQPPAHKGELPTAEVEGGIVYTGSCHCGDVTVAVNSKPLDETYDEKVAVCNCSICERVSRPPSSPPLQAQASP